MNRRIPGMNGEYLLSHNLSLFSETKSLQNDSLILTFLFYVCNRKCAGIPSAFKNKHLIDMMRKKLLLTFLVIFTLGIFKTHAQQKYTISGYVKNAKDGEAMIGVVISVKETGYGVATNPYGFYSLTMPKGTYTVNYGFLGYETQQKTISLEGNQMINIQMTEKSDLLQEVEILAAKKNENITNMEMSMNKMDIREIKSMPALLGEVDVIRSIQTLPGVSTVGEGASGFNVRGGGVDQNLILLDEAPVYNSSHLMGFFSVFNPDAVKDVKLLKGGIPAQYGGRLSSLLDVRMKDGNTKTLAGNGGIGLISSRFTIEAPIVKDKSSFIVAGRRSYGDLFLKLSPDEDLRNNGAYFYDLSAKVNYTIDDKNRVYLSGYFGRDVFNFGDQFNMSWGNATGTVRWNHLFNQRLFSNLTLVYSDFDYSLGIPKGAQAFSWKSNILNYSPKMDFTYYANSNNTLTFGASTIFYDFHPGKVTPESPESIFRTLEMARQRGNEYAMYIDNEQKITPLFSIQYGIRFSAFDYLGEHYVYDYNDNGTERKLPTNGRYYGKAESIAFYPNLEPRFGANYTLNEFSSLKFSYNHMVQYIHLISGTTAASPTDVWSPSTNNIKPELADQVALGYFRNFQKDKYEASVEAFYKTMDNQIDYVNGAQLLLNENLEAELLYGKGRAYGLEFYAKKNEGRFHGFISYTLSRSERKISGLNNDKYYPAKYDKTHSLSVVGMYDLNKRLSFSGNFSYGTGVATTFPNARYEYGGLIVPHNSNNTRNNYRVPAYHRLDVAATLKNKGKAGRKFESEWVFSVYNVYARRNAFSVYFRQNEDNPQLTEAVRLSVFGSMLPSVTYNFKF
jgi:hypothetical protein